MVLVKTSKLCSLFRAQATATVGSCPRWSVTTVETMGLAAATATVAAKRVAKIIATPLVRPSSTSCLTIKLGIMRVCLVEVFFSYGGFSDGGFLRWSIFLDGILRWNVSDGWFMLRIAID
ncbi:hypothetical protein Tco_0754769 [Tanacetum coccineum]